eukprot:881755_1
MTPLVIFITIYFVNIVSSSFQFYVSSTNGDDTSSGLDIYNSFKTIRRAEEAIRSLKRNIYGADYYIPQGGIIVNIEKGIYFESLHFSDIDSGTKNAYIRYTSYPKNNKLVKLSGG